MNLQVLGDDICYGSDDISYGRDEVYGNWLTDAYKTVSGTVSKIAGSTVGKAAIQAGTTAAVNSLTPTQKAQVAQLQAMSGVTPQNFTNTSPTIVQMPGSSMLPMYIAGGALVLGLVIMLATKK